MSRTVSRMCVYYGCNVNALRLHALFRWLFDTSNVGAYVRSVDHQQIKLVCSTGPRAVNRLRPDLISKFEHLYRDDTVAQYIYHCNAQHPRSVSPW